MGKATLAIANEPSVSLSGIPTFVSAPTQVFSICGDSCVGKGTLIDALNERPEIRKRFGLTSAPVFYASRKETRSGRTQYRELDDMYSSPADCIVFRWQYKADAEIGKLLDKYPLADHRIILLWAPWDEHQRRRDEIHKPNFASVCKVWPEHILPRFGPSGNLRALGIPIELVNASTSDYREMDTWPAC